MREELAAEWMQALQRASYRLTTPRRTVVEVLAASDTLLTAAEVYERARTNYTSLGLVTVYRTLDALEEMGLIQRVHRPSGCQGFVAAARGHEHLLICQGCGKVEYFGGDNLDSLIACVAQASGYTVTGHWLQLFGKCADCF